MSRTMNRVFLMGHLAAKPELRTSKAGKPYARLNLATNRYRGPDEKESTDWHSVFVFGNDAENCARWLDRGATLLVEGTLSYWQIEKAGVEKTYHNAINADHIRFITYAGKGVANSAAEDVDNSEAGQNNNAVAHLQ